MIYYNIIFKSDINPHIPGINSHILIISPHIPDKFLISGDSLQAALAFPEDGKLQSNACEVSRVSRVRVGVSSSPPKMGYIMSNIYIYVYAYILWIYIYIYNIYIYIWLYIIMYIYIYDDKICVLPSVMYTNLLIFNLSYGYHVS